MLRPRRVQQRRLAEHLAQADLDVARHRAQRATVRKQKQNPTLEGKRPTLVAEPLLKLRTEYDTPWLPGLVLVAGFSYTSDQYTDVKNTDRLPSFTLYDAGARYLTAVAGRPLTLRLEMLNLGDKPYWANGAHLGDPRILSFSVSADF